LAEFPFLEPQDLNEIIHGLGGLLGRVVFFKKTVGSGAPVIAFTSLFSPCLFWLTFAVATLVLSLWFWSVITGAMSRGCGTLSGLRYSVGRFPT